MLKTYLVVIGTVQLARQTIRNGSEIKLAPADAASLLASGTIIEQEGKSAPAPKASSAPAPTSTSTPELKPDEFAGLNAKEASKAAAKVESLDILDAYRDAETARADGARTSVMKAIADRQAQLEEDADNEQDE